MSTPDRRAISALPLLVTWILADHHHAPMATDDLALFTHGLHARSYLHRFSSLSNSVPLLLPAVPLRALPVPRCDLVRRRLVKLRPGRSRGASSRQTSCLLYTSPSPRDRQK